MATIILQAAVGFLGGFLGPVGATLGTAAGAIAGYAIDRALLSGTRHYQGPRLSAPRAFSGEEGAPLPRLYGTVRTGGALIWATRFEEQSTTSRQGGKGGPKVTTYSYFANAAFALCEGEIAGVRRIWADGREVDRNQVEIRIHTGGETQPVDPLIAAKQGSGNAPAYRGTAYAVIDRLPIDDYGRRLPQFQFEVLRPVGDLNRRIRSVALIPGATEYGLSPQPVTVRTRPGEDVAVNRNTLLADSDLEASLDELQMLFPDLQTVSLVVAWFGTDLRAGQCRILPRVTHHAAGGPLSWTDIWAKLGLPIDTISQWIGSMPLSDWVVSGVTRHAAGIVSHTQQGAAYGGTPSDRSVMDAIAAIRARGLKVWLYPFVMMDVPAGNALPDPHGGDHQPPYPWRGRITCDPAPGRPASADKTPAAGGQIAAFLGAAATGDYAPAAATINFSGDPDDWGYRRFLLHYAMLAVAAGGVDGFLIGSELRGLTTVRDETGQFPFVEGLRQLAADARTILGPATTITYGADWTEYFGHQPADGTGDVLFHLDGLWAHPAIDAVGIDNYMPLSDWRDSDHAGDSPDGAGAPYELEALKAGIASGEGFDWHYASAADRRARVRTPIADIAYGKPWTFRYKDIAGWWSNFHHDRPGGIEAPAPTAWIPGSKPVIFTELGCAAVDKGPNQPNVFLDAKSAESGLPHFSDGGRSDLAQHRFLAAHYAHWSEVPARNPVSSVYGGPMVDPDRISVWAWDARPFPAFPLRGDLWGDARNWPTGHWLNGRAGSVSLSDLINAILRDHGLPEADTEMADGTVVGYAVADPTTARSAIEPIAALFGVHAREGADGLAFANAYPDLSDIADLVVVEGRPEIERQRVPDHELPAELQLDFRDQMRDHQAATVLAVQTGTASRNSDFVSFPGVLAREEASRQAAALLQRHWAGRETAVFSLPPTDLSIGPGALIRLPGGPDGPDYLVTDVEHGTARTARARRVRRNPPPPAPIESEPMPERQAAGNSLPFAVLLDLPMPGSGVEPAAQLRVAARAAPWREHLVFASPEGEGFELRASLARRATMGVLQTAVGGGFEGRIDRHAELAVELFDASLQSVSQTQLLNGANVAALFSQSGDWEILQFLEAEETAPSTWRLRGLLRGQLGTADAMMAGAPAGAIFVLLDEAVGSAGLKASEVGLTRNWRVGLRGEVLGGDRFLQIAASGGVRSQKPLSPVHLRAQLLSSGNIALSWIRRGRIDADGWQAEEILLGEAEERYRIDVAAGQDPPVRSATATTTQWIYAAAELAADFPVPPAALDFTVRQVSASVGPGIAARITVAL